MEGANLYILVGVLVLLVALIVFKAIRRLR